MRWGGGGAGRGQVSASLGRTEPENQSERAVSHWLTCTVAGVTLYGVCVSPLRGVAPF